MWNTNTVRKTHTPSFIVAALYYSDLTRPVSGTYETGLSTLKMIAVSIPLSGFKMNINIIIKINSISSPDPVCHIHYRGFWLSVFTLLFAVLDSRRLFHNNPPRNLHIGACIYNGFLSLQSNLSLNWPYGKRVKCCNTGTSYMFARWPQQHML